MAGSGCRKKVCSGFLATPVPCGVIRGKSTSRRAYEDGFTGRIAIHPDQVPVINEAFVPSAADIAAAMRVLEAFAANPGAGAVSIDGRMYDIPHLEQARRVLAQAGNKSVRPGVRAETTS